MDAITPANLRESGRAGPVRTVLRLLARAGEALARRADNRRVLGLLSRMSERELRDIGLARQDLCDALALHPAVDASHLLVSRRTERQAARVAGRVRLG
ncbi:DUF1127 domain-containing protein [Methylobacterium sp. A54F]